ncbi:hypothetical protein FGO68_gene3691 [Halteria grandinella]|uniref:Uncharacterized protein n=1 Tax=Halteria grandinella TaxID=5974 RepID=A0A8J8NXA1_HALGN|nr:hypothetical protein FGO68_gene3691 [Halteria grandinella]
MTDRHSSKFQRSDDDYRYTELKKPLQPIVLNEAFGQPYVPTDGYVAVGTQPQHLMSMHSQPHYEQPHHYNTDASQLPRMLTPKMQRSTLLERDLEEEDSEGKLTRKVKFRKTENTHIKRRLPGGQQPKAIRSDRHRSLNIENGKAPGIVAAEADPYTGNGESAQGISNPVPSRIRRVWHVLKAFLERISIGQYDTKLYDAKLRGYQSTWIGGILTVGCAFLVLILTISILVSTLDPSNVYVDERPVGWINSPYSKLTLKELTQHGYHLPKFEVGFDPSKMSKICLMDNNANKDEHRFCYRKPEGTQHATFGIGILDTDYIEDKEWPAEFEYKSLGELQKYILNKDPSKLNQDFPSHYIWSVYNRTEFLVFSQETQDIVGGKNASSKITPERIQFNYDEYAIYITLKLVNKIDETDKDLYDFGSSFLNKLAEWFFKVDLSAHPLGELYIRSDIKVLTKRQVPMTETTIALFIDPVIIEQTVHCGTPLEAIAKIGGILFVLRIAFIIRFFHEHYFERRMRYLYARPRIELQSSSSSVVENPPKQNVRNGINDSMADASLEVRDLKASRIIDQEVMDITNQKTPIHKDNYFKELFSFETFKELVERVDTLEVESTSANASQIGDSLQQKFEMLRQRMENAQSQVIEELQKENMGLKQQLSLVSKAVERQEGQIELLSRALYNKKTQ